MRHIGEVATTQQAEQFLSYLLVNGIAGQSEVASDAIEIWIKEEDHFEQAIKELTDFKGQPENPKYADAVASARQILREKEKRNREIQKRIVSPATGGNIGPTAYLTPILIGICVLVALVTNFGQADFDNVAFQYLNYTYVGPLTEAQFDWAISIVNNPDSLNARTISLQRGEVWRVITPIFLHFGIIHILFNMWWLASLGSSIEKRYGMLSLGLLVLVSAVLPNMAQCMVPGAWGGSAPVVFNNHILVGGGGMSGVVYGLLGFVWIKSAYDPKSGLYISDFNVIFMLAWLVACCFGPQLHQMGITIIPDNVANWAHGIGLLVGATAGYLTSPR